MNRKKITLKIELTKLELEKIQERYHFSAEDEKRLEEMYQRLLSFVQPEVYYRICKKGEIAGIPYQTYGIVLVTLSESVDRLIELENNAGNFLNVYMLDCIALEMLAKTYPQIAELIYKETGLWQESYEFFGNELPIENLSFSLENFFDFFKLPVSLSKTGMMIPEKSVLYVAKLTEKKNENLCNICETCHNKNCQNKAVK